MNITIHIHRTTDRLPTPLLQYLPRAGPGGRLLRRQRDNRRGGPQDWPARDLIEKRESQCSRHNAAVGAGVTC